jgi:solute carrier family 25 folate transporter 32
MHILFQDHAFAGIGAGTVAVLCMNPLDLLKVKFQVSTRGPEGGIGRGIWPALCDIRASEGWRGLYRGLGPNVAGNASSWGLYFLLWAFHFPSHHNRILNVHSDLQLQSAQEARD